jgi:hypothetical protein
VAKRPTTSTIGSGFYGTNQLNDNFDAINTAFDNTLSLDGSTPNQMTADFDLNNNDILNVSSLQASGITLNGVGITPTSVAATPAASSIVMTDAGGYYTVDNVESALQEVQTQLVASYQPLDAQLTTLAATSITGVTGTDLDLVTGTAGTSGNVATWNADGDIVDGGYAPGAMVFIQSQDASASATLDFTGFDATKYDGYVFIMSGLVPSSNGDVLYLRTSTDGGSSYDAGASDYNYGYVGTYLGGTLTNSGDETAAAIFLANIGEKNSGAGISGKVSIFGPHLTKKTGVTFEVKGESLVLGNYFVSGGGERVSAADVDAARFLYISGNITSGTITMYGLRNS